jgi:hypothetical protein
MNNVDMPQQPTLGIFDYWTKMFKIIMNVDSNMEEWKRKSKEQSYLYHHDTIQQRPTRHSLEKRIAREL